MKDENRNNKTGIFASFRNTTEPLAVITDEHYRMDRPQDVTIDGVPIPETDVRYAGIERLILIVDDDPKFRDTYNDEAVSKFGSDNKVSICVAGSVSEVEKELAKYHKYSPKARIGALLDWNFYENRPGERKPIEALFWRESGATRPTNDFQEYLNNGGIVIIRSGYPEQVRGSQIVSNVQEVYTDLAYFIAKKSDPRVENKDLFNVLGYLAEPNKIATYRQVATKFNYDLGLVVELVKKTQRK